MIEEEPESHDAHVRMAIKVFRDCGFTLAAMEYKRPPEALAALKGSIACQTALKYLSLGIITQINGQEIDGLELGNYQDERHRRA